MDITTGFTSEKDAHGVLRSITSLDELAKVITEENYSLATFKDNHRTRANFLQSKAIALDFDGGYSIDQAVKEFAEYSHIIAPSRSHRKEKNDKVDDRFRVILILDRVVTDAADYTATWHELAKKWPACDPACKDGSRLWFPSTSVVSVHQGRKVPVVKYKPIEKSSTSPVEYTASDRGTLAKSTKDLLADGHENGGRNNAVAKAARDFQQNLYTVEEAVETIVSALSFNGTIANDFPESEVITTIKSVYSTQARHEPRIKPKAFKLRKIGDLYKEKTKLEWIVEGLLTKGGVSLMSSDPKAGKSTLVRQLMRDVLRGSTFLGRQCIQGCVHYYGIEEQVEVVNASFQRLGVTAEDNLLVHVGDPLTESVFEDFRELLLETKPVIAVIDTLFDFVSVESENNYKEVKRELRRMRNVARETGTHILLVHHNSKGQKDDNRRGNRGILGSQAIAGGVDTIMVLEVEGRSRIISTTGREIKRWQNRELVWHDKDCTYTLGPESDDF